MNKNAVRADHQNHIRITIRKALMGACIASLGALSSAPAQAGIEEDKFALWPSQGYFRAYPQEPLDKRFSIFGSADLGFDDNIFRISDSVDPAVFSGDRGDRYAKLAAGLHAELDFSLQQFKLDATIGQYIFDRFSELDATVYDANADFLWKIGDRAHGDIGIATNQRLPNFADQRLANEDLISSVSGHASIALRLLSRVEARALAEEVRFEHDDVTRSILDNTVQTGTLGLVYLSPTEYTIGVQYKVAEGEYPNRQAVGIATFNNDYRETEASFIFTKVFEINGGFDLRIGQTEREHDEVPQRDFDGVTGRATLRYPMRPKITLAVEAYRELRAIEELAASYAVVDGGSIGPSWAPTLKTVLQVVFVYEKREFAGDPGLVVSTLPPREDRTRSGRIAAGYQPSEHFLIGVSYERGKRDANIPFNDYDYNLVEVHLVASL